MKNDLETAGNGKGRSAGRSTSHNTVWPASSSSQLQASSHRQSTSASASSSYHSPSPSRLSTFGAYTSRPIQTSPEREKRKSREESPQLRRVPEDGDAMEFYPTPISQSSSRQGNDQQEAESMRISWPTITAAGSTSGQPLIMDEDEEEEEEQWILDEELARQGLHRGSYRQVVGLYSLTPLFTFLVFLALAYLPQAAYPLSKNKKPGFPYPYSPYLPFPFPEVLTATAFWGLSYLLNSAMFSFFSSTLTSRPILSLCLSTLFQSSLGLILRQATVPILLIPRTAAFDHPTWRDISFRRVWWLALGWAAAEAVVGIKQGYDGIALYRDVLVSVRRVVTSPNPTQKRQNVPVSGYGSVSNENSRGREMPGHTVSTSRDPVDIESRPLLERQSSVVSSLASQSDAQLKDAIEEEVERDVDELIALRGREDLEDLYGMPFIVSPFPVDVLL
ncbi:hypothetical protein AN958_05389 [Leucoagaricus sp. SymC.cos]|nr:hypothetical protein AN958_05389 [Leucoagaricus sp. SymC.cos]